MLIGIDASRAFIKNRTGIEEYSYQVVKNLADKLDGHEVILYISTNYELSTNIRITNIEKDIKKELNLPENWKVKVIKWPRFWTQIGLSLEMLLRSVDVLFVPAHTIPIIHPKNSVVVIHGLEYEFYPEAYSWWEKFYMRRVIKNSCRWASKIICVSQNTKKDLMKLYKTPEEKIEVIYEGVISNFQFPISNDKIFNEIKNNPYLLFIGRLEKRKNIIGIIKAFEILKEKYNIPHKLVLAGMPGHGYEKIKHATRNTQHNKDIIETGYVSEENKRELLKNAEVFLFPSFYEGFGLPILEAQSVGTPVVAGDNSSMREVVSGNFEFRISNFDSNSNDRISNEKKEINNSKLSNSEFNQNSKFKIQNSTLLVDPHNLEEITEAVYKLISDKDLRNDTIEKGYENVKRFSWKKCANSVVKLLNS